MLSFLVVDDMEQWISDTFYTNFPSFRNQDKKEQVDLESRRNVELNKGHQNQIPSESSRYKSALQTSYDRDADKPNERPVRSNESSAISIDGSDLSSLHSVPNRYSHLRHTQLASFFDGNSAKDMDALRKQTEIEVARKKQYQKELIQQIEDKRRSIKLLKEAEVQQEKVLTRRLQEQLKTIQLEEQLEKERLRATKMRYDVEQNNVMREVILSKLANDSYIQKEPGRLKAPQVPNGKDKENISSHSDNKVYKFFSNSQRLEYNYGKANIPYGEARTLDKLPELPEKIERECFHLKDKICPMCDGPLRSFDYYCLRCLTKSEMPANLNAKSKCVDSNNQVAANPCGEQHFFLVCLKCQFLYTLCPKCLSNSDVCKACQSKKNVCDSCRRALCSFCLDEVARGRDTEIRHINDTDSNIAQRQVDSNKSNTDSQANDKRFTVNDMNTSGVHSVTTDDLKNDSSLLDNNSLRSINDAYTDNPYPLEVESHNFFSSSESDDKRIERLRHETNVKLSRYLKNYSELAAQKPGSPTTNYTTSRHADEEYNLSIPLLREMPKVMRKKENHIVVARNFQPNTMDDLKRRWDIPAVQKHTVSHTSPRVITQIGAIRKQLQTDKMFPNNVFN